MAKRRSRRPKSRSSGQRVRTGATVRPIPGQSSQRKTATPSTKPVGSRATSTQSDHLRRLPEPVVYFLTVLLATGLGILSILLPSDVGFWWRILFIAGMTIVLLMIVAKNRRLRRKLTATLVGLFVLIGMINLLPATVSRGEDGRHTLQSDPRSRYLGGSRTRHVRGVEGGSSRPTTTHLILTPGTVGTN